MDDTNKCHGWGFQLFTALVEPVFFLLFLDDVSQCWAFWMNTSTIFCDNGIWCITSRKIYKGRKREMKLQKKTTTSWLLLLQKVRSLKACSILWGWHVGNIPYAYPRIRWIGNYWSNASYLASSQEGMGLVRAFSSLLWKANSVCHFSLRSDDKTGVRNCQSG